MKTLEKFLNEVKGTSFNYDKVARDPMCGFNKKIL